MSRTPATRTSIGVPVGNTAATPRSRRAWHVGDGDRPADHHLDVGEAGGPQGVDGPAGEAQVGAGEDRQADDVDVFLRRAVAAIASGVWRMPV